MTKGKTIETSLEEISYDEYVKQKVKIFLRDNPLTTYTITGLMLLLFGRKEINMVGSYGDWKNKEDIELYMNIKVQLEELVSEMKVNCIRQGKKGRGNYWWNV